MPENTQDNLEELRQLHPADLADELQRLSVEETQDVLRELPPPLAASALNEIEPERAAELVETLSADDLGRLSRELEPSAVADLIAPLPPTQRRAVLARLSREESGKVAALLHYPPDTAGGIMSDRFVSLHPDQTVEEAQRVLRTQGESRPDEISYIYVLDSERRLAGVVRLRDLVFSRPDRRIAEITNPDVKLLKVTADKEEVAREFQHYHYLALPVVDEDGHMVGVVKASDALDIARAEATEDMQLMVGLPGEERALTPWSISIRRRLPWLYINLATAFLAAVVVGAFESTIAQWTALAVFLPVIAGQGGNAGMQTLTVIIRDLALGELAPGDGRRALLKELIVGSVNGLVIGLSVGLIGYLWKGDLTLGWIAAAAMVLNQVAAVLAGVAIPFGLKALRVDPALASSILVTTVTDVAGFFFFLSLAFLAMR